MDVNLDALISLNNEIIVIVNQVSLSLLILLIGLIAGKLVEKLSLLVLKNSSFKRIKLFSLSFNAEKIIPKVLSYIIYVLGIIFALSYSGLLKIVIYLILAIFIVTIMFSAFLALQESLPNLIASIKLRKNSNFRLKKKIKINNISGEISGITYSEIKITTEKGDEIRAPCKLFIKKGYEILE